MLLWFLEPAFLVDPQTLVITFPSVLPHRPPFIITATISLVPTALGACLCNWTEGERCEQPRSLTVFDRVNLSKLAVFSLFSYLSCWTRITTGDFFLKGSSSGNWASYFQWRADPCSHLSWVMRWLLGQYPCWATIRRPIITLCFDKLKLELWEKRQWPPADSFDLKQRQSFWRTWLTMIRKVNVLTFQTISHCAKFYSTAENVVETHILL